MGPETAAHKRLIAEANASARAWDADERYEEVCRLCAIVESHMISAREAAWRMEEALLNTHLGHAREGLILAIRAARKAG